MKMNFGAVFAALLSGVLIHESAGLGEQIDISAMTNILRGLGNMFGAAVDTVDVSQKMLMGRWHQMYKAAINFDVFRTNMYCPVAYFRPNSVMGNDGFSIQEAYRVIAKDGPVETYKRDVTKAGPGQFWMYTEEYFYPRQFYIIKAGPAQMKKDMMMNTTEEMMSKGNDSMAEKDMNEMDQGRYEYLVVTDSNRLALMVFARDPLQFRAKYNTEVLEFLKTQKFGDGIFWNAPRAIYQEPDCDWPSEAEVFARRVLKNQKSSRQNSAYGSSTGGGGFGIANAIGALATNSLGGGSNYQKPQPRYTNPRNFGGLNLFGKKR